ncbi:E3 SUMO-protein ligase pias1 [Sparganum proliferum]
MQTLSRLSSVSLTTREAANDYADGHAPHHMQSPGEARPSQVSFSSGELPLPYSSPSMCQPQYASASKTIPNRQTQKVTPERTNSNCFSPPTTRPNVDSITLATSGGILRIPTCPPGLSFTNSPFFKVIEVIRPPTILSPSELNFIPGKRPYERALSLKISIDQAEAITYHSQRLDDKRLDFGVQVIMRFAKLDQSDLVNLRIGEPKQQQQESLSPQPDNFPIHLMLHVNGRPAQLPPLLPTTRPGLDGRRNARPVNITPLLRVSPAVSNTVKLVWTHDYATYSYFFYAVYLARKRSTRELCEALRRHSFQTASVTKQKIIEKLAYTAAPSNTTEDADLVIENTLPVQLLCPLSKCRIDLPVRGQNCQHIQCYDANTYLLINERKPAWKCPVCDVPAPFHELLVDGLMLEILADTMTENLDEIVFKEDSSWSPVGKFGSLSNSHPAAASWTDKSPSVPKQPLSCSTCPPDLPTSSPRFIQPPEDTPVSKAGGGGSGGGGCGSSGNSTNGPILSTAVVPPGLESRKRSLPASSGGPTFSLPRSSPASSASSQAPESEPGLTIDLTESDEEAEVSSKRRPGDKLFPETIRPRSVGKPPTESAIGAQRPSSLNSTYSTASTSGPSHMSAFGPGASSSSSAFCSTAASPSCMATTPATSTASQRGQKSSGQPYPYHHQKHSYSPSGQLQQQQHHHHHQSAGGGSPNHRGISTTAVAAVPAAIPSGASAPFASAMLACATEQFYSAMLTNSAAAAAARSSSQAGAAALPTATATDGSPLHSVPSTAALRSRGQQPSVPQPPPSSSRQLGSFNSPVNCPPQIQRSLSFADAYPPSHIAPKQRTLHDPAFNWSHPSPPTPQGTLTFPTTHLRPNTCSPQDMNQAHQETLRRQHLSSPSCSSSFLPPSAHCSPTSSSDSAHTPASEPFLDVATRVNRLRPTLRSQVTASVAAAAAAAAAATLSSMQSAYHLPRHQADAGLTSSAAPLSSMSCLIDAQRSAALLAASSPAVARAAQAWLTKSMFGMAAAAAAATAGDGSYRFNFGRPSAGSPPGGAIDPRPGWPYAASSPPSSSSSPPPPPQ